MEETLSRCEKLKDFNYYLTSSQDANRMRIEAADKRYKEGTAHGGLASMPTT